MKKMTVGWNKKRGRQIYMGKSLGHRIHYVFFHLLSPKYNPMTCFMNLILISVQFLKYVLIAQ